MNEPTQTKGRPQRDPEAALVESVVQGKGSCGAANVNQRAAQYLEKLPPSIQGSGGSAALFEAACILVRGFALSEEQAFPLLARWNQTHCQPEWREHELRYKLKSANQSTRPLGYLLQAEYRPSTLTPTFESEEERKARKRQSWPAFKPLTMAGIQTVARLRKVPVDPVINAALNGYLCGAIVDDHNCFIIRDGAFAQARRLDGGLLRTKSGDTKAKNLDGSQGAFVGHGKWLGGPTVKVLLVEGAAGLLEGIAAEHLVTPDEGWTVIAATSASSRFNRDPDLLKALTGRHVVIVADDDKAGIDGALSWHEDLKTVGCTVRVTQAPDGIKDLGPIVANPQTYLSTLKDLFQ